VDQISDRSRFHNDKQTPKDEITVTYQNPVYTKYISTENVQRNIRTQILLSVVQQAITYSLVVFIKAEAAEETS
jgi:hypothetical protein